MTTEPDDPTIAIEPPRRLWNVVSAGLVAAGVAMLLAGVANAIGAHDLAARDRIELLSSFGASIVTAALALGATLALIQTAMYGRPGAVPPDVRRRVHDRHRHHVAVGLFDMESRDGHGRQSAVRLRGHGSQLRQLAGTRRSDPPARREPGGRRPRDRARQPERAHQRPGH